MKNRHLRLVHSAASVKKGAGKSELKQEIIAQQLGLFDDFNGIKITFVPVADVSYHSFIRALDEKSPCLIVDSRPSPEFFSIFVSHKYAFAEFNRREIEYRRIIIQDRERLESHWEQLGLFKSVLASHLERKINSPIFILSSTNYTLDKMTMWLKNYILREIADARFEEIGE